MRRLHRITALAPLLLAGLAWSVPDRADACGGTFCDSGPNAMPVDQTGENILFVIDGTTVEAHIQIQYDPDTDGRQVRVGRPGHRAAGVLGRLADPVR
jgi:hypothetical protein